MHSTKIFSTFHRLSVRNVITNKRGLQVSLLNRCAQSASADKTSVEETQQQDSTLGQEKKTMNGPFIKNFFIGTVDPDVLEYPEYTCMQQIRDLDKLTTPVQEYFLNCIDSKKIDETKEIPEDTLTALKEHNLYALQAPNQLGGWEVDHKCFARYFESFGTDFSVTTSLASHYRALNALLMFGTEEQKERLIPGLTSGELKVAVCITEKPSILNISDMDTTALPSKDSWTISGKKIWVPNGDKSDYFLVFAKTWRGSINTSTNTELSVFLIEKNAPGVQCSANIDQLGTRGVSLCDVTFDNVVVSKENIIGEFGDGAYVALECLSKGRLGAAAASVGYLKELLNSVAEFTTHTKIENKALYTIEYYQKQLGAMATDIYALESMVYLTAGLRDTYDNPDLTAEEAIIKIFSMEKVVQMVDLCANLVGGPAYIKGSPIERAIRDARSYLIHDVVPVNVSKIHLATIGLHHAGQLIETEIKKARNPFNFPGFALKNFFNDRKALDDDIKIPELVRLRLHPSLSGDADKLERCILRLECIVKNLFRRWGIEVIDRHMDLIKLADCVINMYGMAAVLSRASRSYCIGLSNSNYDLAVANVYCGVNYVKVKELFEVLYNGPMESYDTPCMAVGEQIAMQKGYFFQHPLARNY